MKVALGRHLARSGRVVAARPRRAHPRAVRRAAPRPAAAESQALGSHDRARALVLRRALPALLLGAAARDVGPGEHLQRDDADHDGGHGGASVPRRAAETGADRGHPRRHPGRHGHHRAVAGTGSEPEPHRAVRDPRRDRVLRVQPRVHAQVRLALRYERSGVLIPEHRHRRRHHARADAVRRTDTGRAEPWIIGSVVLLGCLGTGVAYIWNQNTLRAWGPTRASTVTYITPIVGVALGIARPRRGAQLERAGRRLVVFLGILLAQDRLRSLRRVRGARP